MAFGGHLISLDLHRAENLRDSCCVLFDFLLASRVTAPGFRLGPVDPAIGDACGSEDLLCVQS